MTDPLTDFEIDSLIDNWGWVCSDRVSEFKAFVGTPFKNLKFVQTSSVSFFDSLSFDQAIEDEELRQEFRGLILKIEAAGESSERAFEWTLCLTTDLQPVSSTIALRVLKVGFNEAAFGRRQPASHVDEALFDDLSQSYTQHVIAPYNSFYDERSRSQNEWEINRERRSEFDEYVLSRRRPEIPADPAVNPLAGYGDMLAREWWRVKRIQLTDNVKLGVIDELKSIYAAFSDANARGRLKIASEIEEPSIVDHLPLFWEIAHLEPPAR